MELIGNLALGFDAVLTPGNLLYAFLGVVLGTLIGVLPGLGPLVAIALLLPFTFTLDALPALIMLSGIFYGAQYGGSTTAILINLPGEASSIVTTLDGYQMARKGQAGKALATAAIGSFIAGCAATLLIGVFAPPLANVAFEFGPAEYFSLMVCGLVVSIVLAHGSLLKAVGMVVLGLAIGLVGTDVLTGTQRYVFGIPHLADGVSVAAIAMGIFGLGEIVRNLERQHHLEVVSKKLSGLMPSLDDIKRMMLPIVRGTVIGSALGLLPGGGALLSSFTAYAVEKKISPRSKEFGSGAIEGVAAPESANNAGAQTSFVPMLTLGIPSNPVMALMIGAMIIQGIEPGPGVIQQQPELFWGIIVSMWIGNLMLVILNLPMVGLWAKLVTVPYHYLYPAILVFSAIGIFAMNNSSFAVYTLAAFGVLGYVFAKLECEVAPLILGFILGPIMEANLKRAMVISNGDAMIFLTEPISAILLVVAIVSLLTILLPSMKRVRRDALLDSDG